MLYLNATDVRTAAEGLNFVGLVEEVLIDRAHGDCALPDEAYLGWTTPGGAPARSLGMQGAIYRDDSVVVGMKVINANPENVCRRQPRAGGLTLLFDPETAQVRCVMDAAHISAMRTAAVTVLASHLCSLTNVASVAIIGSGPLAWAHLELFAQDLPLLEEVRLFDVDTERARSMCQRAAAELGDGRISFAVRDSAEAAIRDAELVVPVTTTQVGYIHHDWIAPAAVVVNVSLSDVLPDSVLAFDRLFVDDWGLVEADQRRTFGQLAREGRLRGPGEPGEGREVDGELAALVVGAQDGWGSVNDRILVNPFGMSLHDINVGHAVYQRAVELGLGRELD